MSLPLHVDWDGAARGRNGAGRPLLALLHGFAGDGTAWEPVREGLRRLGPTLSVDLIGHGRSPAPEAAERYRIEACLNDLEAVLRALGIPAAWWIGYSMGGRVALNLALYKPRLVRGLVLVSTTAGPESRAEREARVRADEALAQSILAEGMEAFVERWLSQPLFEGLWRTPELRFQAERERRLRQRPDGLARSLRGMGAGAMAPLWERLGEIAVPTQVVTGVEDARFSRIGARLVTAIPGAEMARIPESGHAPHTEQPELFVETLTRFILRHEPLALAGLE